MWYLLRLKFFLQNEEVKMKFITERYPLIITPLEGEEFLYMILPIIIQA